MVKKLLRSVLLVNVAAVVLVACGAPHARVNVLPPAQVDFSRMQLGEVTVFSPEEAAKTNDALQEKMRGWNATAKQELIASATRVGTTFVQDPRALVLSFKSEVHYGNRALRWVSGGGAGQGHVHTELVASDPFTREMRFQVSSNSDLAVGAAGGSVDKMFRRNLTELLAQYENAMKQR